MNSNNEEEELEDDEEGDDDELIDFNQNDDDFDDNDLIDFNNNNNLDDDSEEDKSKGNEIQQKEDLKELEEKLSNENVEDDLGKYFILIKNYRQ